MRKLATKGTNITLSSLGIGTGTGFNKDTFKTQKELFYAFDASFESGVNWIDTAESYAEGYAETLIGEYNNISKNNFFIASKFSPKNASKKLVIKSCENSLKRLNRECIDLYQIHWMNYNVPIEETLEAHKIMSKKNKYASSIIFIKNIIEACDAISMKKVIGDESDPKIIKERVRKSRIEAIKSKINTE